MFDWDDLKLFLALARSSRLAAAARAIGQDATTIGRRLQRLERALETTLFEQTPAGHVLTERGAALLVRAEAMESAALGLQNDLGRGVGRLAGTIRLSVSEGFGTALVAPELAGFAAAYPDVGVDLIASSGFLNPSRREADLAIMLARPKVGPLVTRKLTDYRLGLYASGDYLGRAPRLAGVSDLLAGHRLVGYVPDQIYAPELRYLEEVDGRLVASLRSSSINAQARLIAAGAGCGILPCFIGDGMDGLTRLMADGIDIQRSFWLVVHREVRQVARIARFVEWLDATVTRLQPLLTGRERSL